MFQYWVEQSYDRISFLYLFIGRRFCVRWRNWGDAHPREVVPGQPRLLSELPQHHAHTRRGCRLLHASGEPSRLVSHTSGFTFCCSAAFNQCKQKPQLNITDPIFRRFLATKKFVVVTRSEKFQPVGCFWFIDPTIELSFSFVLRRTLFSLQGWGKVLPAKCANVLWHFLAQSISITYGRRSKMRKFKHRE